MRLPALTCLACAGPLLAIVCGSTTSTSPSVSTHHVFRVLHSKLEETQAYLLYTAHIPSKTSQITGLVIFMMCDHLAEEALIMDDENGDGAAEGVHTLRLSLRNVAHCV